MHNKRARHQTVFFENVVNNYIIIDETGTTGADASDVARAHQDTWQPLSLDEIDLNEFSTPKKIHSEKIH